MGVLLPLPLRGAYDYLVPEGMEVAAGDFVEVPLGSRSVLGVVWGDAKDDVPRNKLKQIEAKIEMAPLPDISRRFIDWVATYCLSAPGAVLKMAMSVSDAFKPERSLKAYAVGDPESGQVTAARQRVLNALSDVPSMLPGELARAAGVTGGVLAKMAELGQLRVVAQPLAKPFGQADADMPGPQLSPAQHAAADELIQAHAGVTLLDGVTGSGKTEVYFEAIAACLKRGKQALVLLPEIALTSQWLERFTERFGAPPGQWHSELTGLERRLTWRAVLRGDAKVVVGARSALFLPFRDLGLIIVDEEHEQAFKQEDGVVYQARDMAVVRGHLAQIPVILTSATPSLETMHNVETGRYRFLHLPDRHGVAQLPEVRLVDLRREPPPRQSWLSPPLREAVKATLERKEQALLFLNRRGYAPLTLCRACGHRLQCPNCSAWLVEHRYLGRLQCHHCGFESPPPAKCPACQAEGSMAACGPGVERVAEEAAALFPDAARLILTSDTAQRPGQDRGAAAHDRGPRGRPGDRHPDHRQRAPLSQPHAGGRGRCRSRPLRRRFAGVGADVPVAAPGVRPRRPRRSRWPGPDPDLRPQPPGHAGAEGGRPRPLLCPGIGGAPDRRHAALRPAGGRDPLRRRPG